MMGSTELTPACYDVAGMADILLSTFNARYIHAAFGLRYLLANLGELRGRAAILEFDIGQKPTDVLEIILSHNPGIVGLGVYIWNAEPTTKLVVELKRLRPGIKIILGGPEISFETDQQEIARFADYVITGEADLAFADLCRQILAANPPATRIIHAEPPALERLALPYDLYDDRDIRNRIIYVEASRGCPFGCEFCLSSLDVPLRGIPLERFLPAMQSLLDRGGRHFKFVDRTFNVRVDIAAAILQFFLERCQSGLFLHFEMIPDRFPDQLRELIQKFPPGVLQFEVGTQTFNPEVAQLIGRKQDNARAEENLRFLREHTSVHLHCDLIAGLPGEDLPSFSAGFDRLVSLHPQEIQLGILKRLRGAPIARHDEQWQMVYSPHPPYEILQTKLIDFSTMQRLKRFARYWDLVSNSGNFLQTAPLLWRDGSPFASFLALSDWLHERTGRTHAIALKTLTELLWQYLVEKAGRDSAEVADAIQRDYQRCGRTDLPDLLRPGMTTDVAAARALHPTLKRQARHRS